MFRRIVLCVVAVVVLACSDLFASLLTNPNFDTNTAGWPAPTCTVCSAPTVRWSNRDADGLGSGSIVLNNTVPSFGALDVRQCVPVTAGTRYTFGGRLYIPSTNSRPGDAYLGIIWYSEPTCAGGAGSFITSIFSSRQFIDSTPTATWVMDSLAGTAPANAVAAGADLAAYERGSGTPGFEAHFDNLYFDVERVPNITGFSPIGGFPATPSRSLERPCTAPVPRSASTEGPTRSLM